MKFIPPKANWDRGGSDANDCPLQLSALSDAEQRLIIRQVPSLSAKTLDEDQVRLLLNNPATANPLFLLVALEELRGFAPFERLNERIAAFPREGDTVTAIFTQVINRLEEDFDPETARDVSPDFPMEYRRIYCVHA